VNEIKISKAAEAEITSKIRPTKTITEMDEETDVTL
jgi:hypothetical protein